MKNQEVTDLIKQIIEEDLEEITDGEEMIHLLLEKTVSQNTNHSHNATLSFGEKVSDKMASVAGSWGFIGSFCAILFAWITVNGLLLTKAFDPYPFILLNLVLSCMAALQAPILMMSQNRQAQKDRIRSENDYKVNLKSELIVKDLHVKLDKMMEHNELMAKQLEALSNKIK